MDPRAYPLTAHLPPRADGEPRVLSDDGWPIWRISYTDATGARKMMLLPKPIRRWAVTHAQRLAHEYKWTDIVVGRWHGGCDLEPAPRPRRALPDAGGPFGAGRPADHLQ
jgi:hypothetical protein